MASSSGPNGVTGLLKNVKDRLTGSHTDSSSDMPPENQHADGENNANVNKFEQAFVQHHSEDDGAGFHSSDSEGMSAQLEVVFENRDTQRRRASLLPDTARRPQSTRKRTSCFVHSLLEGKTQHGQMPFQDPTLHKPADKEVEHSQDGTHKTADREIEQPQDGKHTQSRLLTKKQLSDMAFGIRELSKKLGHVRLLIKVRNVFLLTKAHDQTLIRKTRDVAEWLLSQGKTVWVEDTMQNSNCFDASGLIAQDPSYKERLKYWTNELCAKKPHLFEICLALGGDGTVLYASWLFQRVVPPVMSFALGSLGFLTKFDFDRHPEILQRAFTEGVTVSLRLRFEATIMRAVHKEDRENQASRDLIDELIGEASDDASTHRPDGSHNILNDIVLDRGPNATMTSIEVFGDDDHFTTVQADGICVATPTGSTAYNLAAGGSLCHPDNPVILVTAIAPHTLSFRPIILPDTIVLRIGVPYDARASCWTSFDGKERCELRPGDYVTISASRFPFPSVLPLDRRSEDWVDSISRTLNWNNRQRQKAFDKSEQRH